MNTDLEIKRDKKGKAIPHTMLSEEDAAIKELNEAFDALEVIAEFASKVAADKKVDASDFKHVLGLISESDKLIRGVTGLRELKGLALSRNLGFLLIDRAIGVLEKFRDAKGSELKESSN